MIDETSDFKIETIDVSSREQELKDMETLQKIIEGQVKITELDEFTKRRIIKICNDRLDVMKAKVENRKKEILRLEEILHKVKRI